MNNTEFIIPREQKNPPTLKDFHDSILPGILERTKKLGHFQDQANHKSLSPDEMSDCPKEDFVYYSRVVDDIKKVLGFLEEEKDQTKLFSQLNVIRSELDDEFKKYGAPDKQGTHYFSEYIRNKASILSLRIQRLGMGASTLEDVRKELDGLLWELTGGYGNSQSPSVFSELSLR